MADRSTASIPDRTVLIVDDDAVDREMLGSLLEIHGYFAKTASSGEDALRELRQERPMAILLDLRMPGMDGWEVTRRLKTDSELSSIPIILVSGERKLARTAVSLGVAGHVRKPVDVPRLIGLLDAIK